ncbi:RNA-splicing factor [Coemansia aciculifera]|uniref:Pre-mRNA-splicing factor CWC24 n=1 Tax=Coemansia aciculifera TaxID=417176 RepID=A0A9W8IMN4_9FUNG|nr:RNA-splicing factor [Coemansia aciculifera]
MTDVPDKEQALPLFKKSKRRGVNLRKRPIDSGIDDIADNIDTLATGEAAPVSKGDATTGARAPKQPRQSSNAAPGGSDANSQDAEPATYQTVDSASTPSTQNVTYHYKTAMDSTRSVEYDAPSATSPDLLLPTDNADAGASTDGETLYKGKKGYSSRIQARDGSRKAGPFKAPSNVRATSVFDYQPNLCKDYKETGYCGYGDSCIFLHDRSTTKTGWQLEKEFEEAQQGVQRDNPKLWQVDSDSDNEASSGKAGRKKSSTEELPFACLICREPFTKPVVTKCQHYFCEACALAQYRKTPKCFACGAATAGVFKQAKNLKPGLQ